MLEAVQQRQELRRRRDDDVRQSHELVRRFVRGDGDANGDLQSVQGSEGVRVGRVVPRVERSAEARLVEQLSYRRSLVRMYGRANLEHLSPEAGDEPGPPSLLGNLLEILEGCDLVLGLAVVERDGEALVLDRPVDAGCERVNLVAPVVGFRRELEAVGTHVADALDADHAAGVFSRPTADTGDEGVTAGEPGDLGASLVRRPRVLGTRRDRRQRPVDVEHDRSALRGLGESVDRSHGSYDTGVRFVAIGLAAGFFSALFGVGGGIVVVPLLILAAGFAERSAMATSLAAIGLIAFAGTVSYALRGDVHWDYGLLLGLPAALGAIGGTALQQRVAGPALSYAFAALLAAVGIWLLV
jgi:uncharacterized protein